MLVKWRQSLKTCFVLLLFSSTNTVRSYVLTCDLFLVYSLSQNCIGDEGVKKLTATLMDLPKMHRLRYLYLYTDTHNIVHMRKTLVHTIISLPFPLLCFSSLCSNVISDEGAESLAVALPHMSSLTELE